MRDEDGLRRAVSRLTRDRAERFVAEISRTLALDPALVRRMILLAQALTAVPGTALPDGKDLASGIVGAFSRCLLLESVPESARWAVVESLFRSACVPVEP